MPSFLPKTYQQSVLDSVRAYFDACHDHGNAATAFFETTRLLWNQGLSYQPIPGFSGDMPYFCLRVPTGGGKTWLAARSVQLINSHLLRTEHSVVLWLVPSTAIRDQTLRALRDRDHPLHAALREAGPVAVIDLAEAKAVTRSTLDTATVVIVATVQAFKREDREGLKVFESSGALMHHFEHLSETQRLSLLKDSDGATTPWSLANVLRLRRPFLVVDEAHNSRTPLSFATFADFLPSGVMELTATPDTTQTPSNVLHSVSAGELKAEEMIKLPIVLEAEADWQRCLADAVARRSELQVLAETEARQGAAYLRPIVLIQAEKRRDGVATRDVHVVRDELLSNHRIPPEEIVIATGEERGLEAIDAEYQKGIADERCPVRFVITQQALAEGWDCPFAYVLMSVASLHSEKSVEQLLGRILRQPGARRRASKALNQSYAFVVSSDFADAARGLRDRLVQGAGFERRDASEFLVASQPSQTDLSLGLGHPVVVRVTSFDPQKVPEALRIKLAWDDVSQTLTLTDPLTTREQTQLRSAASDDATRDNLAVAFQELAEQASAHFQTPAELGVRFQVPQLALAVQGELSLFDDPEVLDYPWDLSTYSADPTAGDLRALQSAGKVAEAGWIDVEDGHVVTRFIDGLQRDLGLAYRPEHWDEVKLATWVCGNLLEPSVTHASKRAFVVRWLSSLLRTPDYTLARANQHKFLIRDLLARRIRELRLAAVETAYQQALFGPGREDRVRVDETYEFEFHPDAYAPDRDYGGQYGRFAFRHHYYGRVGNFDSREEFECATRLDILAEQGRIKFWVRNLVRKEGCSFFLQRADGRFYPDFVCRLPSGQTLVVEYKGADRWDTPDAQADRLLGGLWAEMSGDRCKFVMITDRDWPSIEALLA